MLARKPLSALRLIVVFSLVVPFSAPPAPAEAEPAGGQIGNGTPQSCTAQALRNAVGVGGTWTFACGAAPHTIVVSPGLAVTQTTTLMAGVPGQIILSGGNLNSIFSDVDDDAGLTLQGIILTNGNSGTADGGAIHNRGNLVLNESQVRNSHTGPGYAGGGIYNSYSGEATLTGSSVMGNSAAQGGGLAGDGNFYISQSSVISNTADQGGGLFSGGLLNDGAVYLTSAVFDGNTAESGGAVYFQGVELVISGTTFSNNRAVGGSSSLGGGLYLTRTATLNQVTLSGNSADLGGGLYFDAPGQTLFIDASTLNGNQAAVSGGGLHVEGGDLDMLNVTLSGNVATTGGGLYHKGGSAGLGYVTAVYNTAGPGLGGGLYRHVSASGTVSLFSSVIFGNTGDDCAGTFYSGENNLSGDTSCDLGNDGDQEGEDPLLKPLAHNGGPTQTHFPAENSLVLGAGPVGICAAFDQRGVARPTATACDIGAVEVDPYGPVLGCGGEFAALADTTLNQASPNATAGSAVNLSVSKTGGNSKWTLLNFDLSGLPSGAAVHSARLMLTLAQAATPLPLPLAVKEIGVWNEATVTWNTAPAQGVAYTLPPAQPLNGVVTLDVTTLVTRWLNGEALPGGLAVQPAGAGNLSAVWVSREGAATPNQAPRLIVECAPPVTRVPADETAADADQAASADQLDNDSTDPVSLQFLGSAVRFGSFRLTIPSEIGEDPSERAQWFLDNFRDLLRLGDPATELQLERISDDGLHLFFRQVHAGVPVFPASLVVHLDGYSITGVSGGYVPGITLGPEPILPKERAEALALAAGGPEAALSGDTQLRYLSLDLLESGAGGLYLAWVVRVLGGSRPGGNYVDALSGQLLFTEPIVNEGYDLDLENGGGEAAKELCDVWDDDGIGRDDLPPDSQEATDNFHFTYYYWLHTFGRDSYDDDGEQMEVNINVSYPSPNAAYGLCDLFFFAPNTAKRDIVGHEFTHAVDDSEGQLIYANQSGALDESFADIFGYLVDSDDWLLGEGAAGATAPVIGAPTCNPAIPAIRDMRHPPCFGDPDHMLAVVSGDSQGLRVLPAGTAPDCTSGPSGNDCGFVHTNSGINNKAAYLVIQGGSFNTYNITGIGQTKAQHLFYGVLINRMFKNAQLIDARNAAVSDAQLNAATGHLGFNPTDVCSVRNAYAAVGLGNGDRDCDGAEDNVDPDQDGDRVANTADNCPTIWNPGQLNLDGDAQGDACDNDQDGDTILTGTDNCPTVANPSQANFNVDAEGDACDDTDLDGRWDDGDNCREVKNPGQENTDGDSEGDACDRDLDGDGWENNLDNCPQHRNWLQEDTTETSLSLPADGVGDACDLCPAVSSSDNRDLDGDGRANPCDDDDDGDGYLDGADNCPETFSRSQLDWDHDGLGFACDPGEQTSFGSILSNINQSYVRVDKFRLPLPICFACTTNYLPVGYKSVIQLTLPILFQARVVDSYGQVVAKSTSLGAVKTLTISPLAFAAVFLSGQRAQGLAEGAPDLPLTEFGPEAIRYYLVIEAAPGTDLGQEYPLSLQIVESALTDELFLPLVWR